jgi:hypothetical protein
MAVTLRSGLNRQLTHAEMDENFRPLKEALNGTASVTERGFWPDVDASTQIWRLRDRVFIGDAASSTGNRFGTQTAWPAVAADGPNWVVRDSTLLSIANSGNIAVAGLSRATDQTWSSNPGEVIGVVGYAEADVASSVAWGGYFEVVRRSDTAYGYGIEVDAKNIGANVTPTSYTVANDTVFGVWVAAGGDDAYGGAPTNPSGAAIVIKGNDSTWNTGIVFEKGALTGADGSTGTGTAIEMATGHRIRWRMTGNFSTAEIRSAVDNSSQNTLMLFANNQVQFYNNGSKRSVQLEHVANGVNFVNISGSIASSPVVVEARGDDTNVGVKLLPKGSEVVWFGTHSAIGAETVTGYITIKDSSGNSRKLAVVS